MALTLELVDIAPAARVTTVSSPVVRVDVVNQGGEPAEIGGAGHEIFLELRDEGGALLLVLDEALRCRMLYERETGVVRRSVTLAPGETRRFEFSLCEYYHPLAAGRYVLEVAARAPDGTEARGDRAVALDVTPAAISAAAFWYENPIFGTHSLLCREVESGSEGEPPSTWLRWVSSENPAGSYACARLDGLAAQGIPFPARAAYWQLEDVEHGLVKVFVQDLGAGRCRISRYLAGRPLERSIDVRLGGAATLVPHAFRMEDGAVLVFGTAESGDLLGYRVSRDGTATECLGHRLQGTAPFALECGPDVIRLIESSPVLKQTIFDHAGQKILETKIFETGLVPVHLSASLVLQVVRAAFVDAGNPRRLKLVEAALPLLDEEVEVRFVDVEVPVGRGARVRDVDFVIDRKVGVALLYATDRGFLIYRDSLGRIHRLARAAHPFFPRVVVAGREVRAPFLGFFRPRFGYRFVRATGDGLRARIDGVRV